MARGAWTRAGAYRGGAGGGRRACEGSRFGQAGISNGKLVFSRNFSGVARGGISLWRRGARPKSSFSSSRLLMTSKHLS
jgi:hypothetical protein